MNHTNKKRLESLILLIDFKKVFNSLSYKYINECMKIFSFGQSIQRWISLFICNREAFILLGGELNEKILLEEGVPQGDVASPYVFILAVKILLIEIDNTRHKRGII